MEFQRAGQKFTAGLFITATALSQKFPPGTQLKGRRSDDASPEKN